MNTTQLNELLDRVTLAPWYRELDWEVEELPFAILEGAEWPFPFARFRIAYMEPDTESGEEAKQYARWWYVESNMDEEAIIKSAWLALTVSDEHRRREGFRMDNALIFNPHNRIIHPRNERIKTYEALPILEGSWRKLYEGEWPEVVEEDPAKVGE